MMATLAEQLARRVRVAAGPHDNPDMSVQQIVYAMAARIVELESVLGDISGLSRHLRSGGPDTMDLQDLSDALSDAVEMACDVLSQQGKENADG